MQLTVPEAGVICLVLFGVFHWLSIFVKTRAFLALLGVVAIGLEGFVGRLFGDIGSWIQQAMGDVTLWAFGVSLSAVAAVVLIVILAADLHPKRSASKRTSWLALLFGMILVAGVAQIPALAPLAGFLRELLSTFVGFINQL